MDVSSPPRYRRFSRPGPAPSSGTDQNLPPYTRRNTLLQPVTLHRAPTEHVYPLVDGRSRPWATLKVYSSAKSAKSLPTFFEKEKINGSLELNVEKGESIQAVTATVTGRIITGADSDSIVTFLSHTVPIWSKSLDVPRLPSTSEGANGSKLLGNCVWPLSIVLPRTVNVPGGAGQIETFRLPETLQERHTRVSVQYDLTIHISRGKLRADNRIKTLFGYVPSSRPEAPSMLRQVAYQQHLPLPGPDADPQGWLTMRPTLTSGMLFKARRVDVRCTMSIAKPLCYSRGTVLPCRLVLESRDSQALDVLSNPSSVVCCLRRRVRFYAKPSAVRTDGSNGFNDSFEDAGTATWWPSNENRSDSITRYLEGEIRLAKDLRPSSNMGHFSISYSVVLHPFDVAGFSPSDNQPLLAEPVEIATMHAKGPRAQAYSPPAYDPTPGQNDFAAPMSVQWNH